MATHSGSSRPSPATYEIGLLPNSYVYFGLVHYQVQRAFLAQVFVHTQETYARGWMKHAAQEPRNDELSATGKGGHETAHTGSSRRLSFVPEVPGLCAKPTTDHRDPFLVRCSVLFCWSGDGGRCRCCGQLRLLRGKPMPGGGVLLLPETMAPGGVILPRVLTFQLGRPRCTGTFLVSLRQSMPRLVVRVSRGQDLSDPRSRSDADMAFPRQHVVVSGLLVGLLLMLSSLVVPVGGLARDGRWYSLRSRRVHELFVGFRSARSWLVALDYLLGSRHSRGVAHYINTSSTTAPPA